MITIAIPALNEEKNIEKTVNTVLQAIQLANNIKAEIIIVNDGSTDRTKEIINTLANKNKNIRTIHFEKNLGLGHFIKTIIKEAKYEKFCLVAGDGNVTLHTLRDYLLNAYKADLILVYLMNTENRLRSRIALSTIYTFIYSITFDIHVKYINGAVVYPTKILQEIEIKSERYGFAAELVVKLLMRGFSFYEMKGYINPSVHKSSALTLKSLIEVIKNFLYLVYEVKFKNKSTYSKEHIRVMD